MAASAQVASLVITVLKYKYLEVLQYYALHVVSLIFQSRPARLRYMCMTDSARDKDEVTKDKKMTICLKL